MRLDVALIPLISHQLQVKQVMLKGAVIQLTRKPKPCVMPMRRWRRVKIPCLMNRLIPAGPLILAS
jgi:hypothetical protein